MLTFKDTLLAFEVAPPKLLSSIIPLIPTDQGSNDFRAFLKNLQQKSLAQKLFQQFLETLLGVWKINLDEISEENLKKLIHNELIKEASKYLRKQT